MFAVVSTFRHVLGYGVIELIAVASALAAAELMYRLVEMPSMRLGRFLTGKLRNF